MEQINIRIATKTHRRLNLLKGRIGVQTLSASTPTLDQVINAGLDLLEDQVDQGKPVPAGEMAEAVAA